MIKHAAWLSIATLGGLLACTRHDADISGPPAKGPDAADRGARLYGGNCVACHQQNARGLEGVYPSLVGSPVLLGNPKDLTLWVLAGQRPSAMPAGRYSTMMPRFGWIKAPEAAALFTYLRSHFGNSAPAVDAAAVAAALRR